MGSFSLDARQGAHDERLDPGAGLLEAQTVEKVLFEALRNGGDFAEVYAEDKRGSSAVFEDGKVAELSSGIDIGAGIRVVAGETTGFAHVSDLSEASLIDAARAASAVAKMGGSGSKVLAAVGDTPLGVHRVSKLPARGEKHAKVELLVRADAKARQEGAAIRQVVVSYADSRRRFLVASSDGVFATDDRVRTRFGVSCVALGDSGFQTSYETVGRTAGFELFDDVSVEEIARVAARRAIAKLSARPAPRGVTAVVLASGSGGILFHEACGHGLEADHIAKDSSVFTGRIGEQVASPLVTLVDDGALDGEWGTCAVDDEGHPAQRNVLIHDGVLCDYMWDRLRASKDRRKSSGNGRRQSYRHLPMVRMTNTYVMPGVEDPDEVVAQTPKGIYVRKLGGGQVNTVTGDFVFGMTEAYLIENGMIADPIRDANLIGNGPEVLKKVDVVASDFAVEPGTCGKDGQMVPVGCGQPTLRVSELTIGGTSGE